MGNGPLDHIEGENKVGANCTQLNKLTVNLYFTGVFQDMLHVKKKGLGD